MKRVVLAKKPEKGRKRPFLTVLAKITKKAEKHVFFTRTFFDFFTFLTPKKVRFLVDAENGPKPSQHRFFREKHEKTRKQKSQEMSPALGIY